MRKLISIIFALAVAVSVNTGCFARSIGASPVGTAVTVGKRSVRIVPANPDRRGLIIVNSSDKHMIYIVPANQTAEVGRGIPVPPNGREWLVYPGFKIGNGWNAISDTDDASIEVLEFF